MRLPISEDYFDASKHWDLIEEFIVEYNWIHPDVLQFATDMYWFETWLEDVLNYYDIEQEFDDYIHENVLDINKIQ